MHFSDDDDGAQPPCALSVGYVDSIAGAGKTYACVSHAARFATPRGGGLRFIIAQPTQTLVNQTDREFAWRFPYVNRRAIHGGNIAPGRKALREILQTIGMARRGGAGSFVLIITQAALRMLPASYRRGWGLMLDEVPSASEHDVINPQRELSRGVLASVCVTQAGPKYSQLAIAPGRIRLWMRIAAGGYDNSEWTTLGLWKPLARALLDPSNDVFVETAKWEAAKAAETQIPFFTTLSPRLISGFASATVMGACVKDSLIYRIWGNWYKVDWVQHQPITKLLRARQHDNGESLRIFYVTERDWSRRGRETDNGTDKTVEQEYIEAALAKLAGGAFVYMANKSLADLPCEHACRLPNSPHGLNNYQHIDNAVIFSSLNPPPLHVRFLNDIGISNEEIRAAIYYASSYQAALRTSLRDPKNTEPKTLIVPDKGCADYIAGLFPGCTTTKMLSNIRKTKPVKTGRPAGRAMTNADRVALGRRRESLTLEMGMSLIDYAGGGQGGASPFVMSLFETVEARVINELQWSGVNALVSDLRRMHDNRFAEKTRNALICPSMFDPNKAAGTSHGRANVVAACGLWLDNDGGDLSKEQFRAIFPATRMVIYNTYRSTPEAERWRVYIPTTYAMGASLYAFVAGQVIMRLEQEGYRSKREIVKLIAQGRTGGEPPPDHGFDMTKVAAENLFYLPCQAEAGPEASFFMDLPGDPIDVKEWIDKRLPRPADEPEPVALAAPAEPDRTPPLVLSPAMQTLTDRLNHLNAQIKHSAIDTRARRIAGAVAVWRQVGAGTGRGNSEFFLLGVKLRGAGMDWHEVEATLDAEAVHGSAERCGEVARIMKNLKRSRKVA